MPLGSTLRAATPADHLPGALRDPARVDLWRHSLEPPRGQRLHILAMLPVGLEPLASGLWNVFFGPMHLGWLGERDYRIHDHRGRVHRERHLLPIS
jgi:hypothetical protein